MLMQAVNELSQARRENQCGRASHIR
jgi:hypothetical protein